MKNKLFLYTNQGGVDCAHRGSSMYIWTKDHHYYQKNDDKNMLVIEEDYVTKEAYGEEGLYYVTRRNVDKVRFIDLRLDIKHGRG